MKTSRWAMTLGGPAIVLLSVTFVAGVEGAGPLDPRGKIHVPIGIANTLDTLKTFVEAEGGFSPGVGSYGISFWVYDRDRKRIFAPTMDGVEVERGLHGQGYLIPWSRWTADGVRVTTEVCQVRRNTPEGDVFIVAARAVLGNDGTQPRDLTLYVALRPLGPAGWDIRKLEVSPQGDALVVDDHPAIVAGHPAGRAGVVATDTIGQSAMAGEVPDGKRTHSPSGDCSGALVFDVQVPPGATRSFELICPVLPGRRAVGHQWDGTSTWAQFDLAELNPSQGGRLQPDPGLDYYRGLSVGGLFAEATEYWRELVGRATIETPDPRWAEAMAAITGHVAISMNQGAPDVAVVNYNVFNRDGVYVANILQKAGQFDLAAQAVDYFLSRPFNGRVYPEADNPGQILWIMGEHWRFTRDRQWLERVYPSVRKLAALIRYYRTTEGPHWVCMRSLQFGDSLPADQRHQLKPGRCDGSHPEYTEAFDVAGLRGAISLAEACGQEGDAADWGKLADRLFASYRDRFEGELPRGYGSYCVLWPCRLYPLDRGEAFEQFRGTGAQQPGGWRYFALARAHQGLLTGNREAGHATLSAHLDHEQMRGWYVFDEGGKSGGGGWPRVRTTWNANVAMPHGWAIAELWLLLRDCLLYEDGDRLVLFAGVPASWLTGSEKVRIMSLPTHFGTCSLTYAPDPTGATLAFAGTCKPPDGFVLRLPLSIEARCTVERKPLARVPGADLLLPLGAREFRLTWAREIGGRGK